MHVKYHKQFVINNYLIPDKSVEVNIKNKFSKWQPLNSRLRCYFLRYWTYYFTLEHTVCPFTVILLMHNVSLIRKKGYV